MIEFSRSYKASDGKCYGTLEEAQTVEIHKVLETSGLKVGRDVAQTIVSNKDEVLNILTLNDTSRPRARGVRKPRKPKVVVAELPLVPTQ